MHDLNLTNHKVDRIINLILCQAPHVDPTTEEYKKHAEIAQLGGKYYFGTPVVLTRLSTYTLPCGGRMIENPIEHLPPTQDIVRGNFTPYLLLNPENLPIKNFFDVQISYPEPIFWYNKLDLFL